MELPHQEQVPDSLLAQNDEAVTQCWQKWRAAMMEESDLEVITACPIIYVPNQCPAYRELDYKVIKDLRTLVKESSISSCCVLSYPGSVSTAYILIPHDWKSIMKMILTVMEFAVWLTVSCVLPRKRCKTETHKLLSCSDWRGSLCSPYSTGRLSMWCIWYHHLPSPASPAVTPGDRYQF